MHVCHAGTQKAIAGAHAIHGTWRKTAKALGYSPNFATVLNQIVKGKPGAISPVKEDELRERLGFPILYGIRVTPCPTCGDAHTVGDCHGKHGQPVIVAEGERVVSSKPKGTGRKRLRREMTTAQAKVWDSMTDDERNKVLGI